MLDMKYADFEIIEKICSKYKAVEILKAKYIPTGQIYCLKKIDVDDLSEANKKFSEFKNSFILEHKNFVSVKNSIIHGSENMIKSIIIVMDYYPEGNLKDYLTKLNKAGSALTDETIIDYAIQLINGFSILQSSNISHRDIKPQNIFVDCEGKILKIGDFGSSRYIKDTSEFTIIGTTIYMSPEMRRAFAERLKSHMLTFQYNPYKSDVFSLGLVIQYMATKIIQSTLTNLDTLKNDIQARLDQIKNNYPATFNLLTKMLEVDSNARPDFIELYSLITNPLFPKKNCFFCSRELTAITQIEFQNLLLCPKCYPLVSPQINCELCHSGKFNDEVIAYDNKFYCRACFINVQTFAIDKL